MHVPNLHQAGISELYHGRLYKVCSHVHSQPEWLHLHARQEPRERGRESLVEQGQQLDNLMSYVACDAILLCQSLIEDLLAKMLPTPLQAPCHAHDLRRSRRTFCLAMRST